jgi:hypothetical protein
LNVSLLINEFNYTYLLICVVGVYFIVSVLRRKFDPFAPVWLFLVGYSQLYIVQALSYHEWAVMARSQPVVVTANFRALWAIVCFLIVYHLPFGPVIARIMPKPPFGWSPKLVAVVSPLLIVWGLYCAGVLIKGGNQNDGDVSAEEFLLRSFPFVMLVAAILLIITAQTSNVTPHFFRLTGLFVGLMYIIIWMFNGKRSHSLIGVLTTMSALYIAHQRRPGWPALSAMSVAGILVVALSIGWRNDAIHEASLRGFADYVTEFKVEKVLESLNIQDSEDSPDAKSYETEEYGGFLLMMDTVPAKADYDYGANYLRTFTTMVPRVIWPTKPLYGRDRWIAAWLAGSEITRDESFTSPSIGILGATQLNGGGIATAFVLSLLALLLRSSYEYYHRYAHVPWAQFWWSIFFYNAWFMVVCDDPMVWFYYNWGFTAFPIVVFFWLALKYFHPKVPLT